MTDRVSVVVPLFNAARYIRQAVESLCAQTLPVGVITCIDDASDDGSADVAASAGAKVLRNATRAGLAANWNRALQLADADYLVIAHHDDVYDPRFLETMIGTLDAYPNAFAAHAKATTIDEDGRPIAHPAGLYKERFWNGDDPMERAPDAEIAVLQRGNYVIAPSVMLRMSAVRALGPFDARYEFVTDWEYWLRGLLAGRTLAGVPRRLIGFRRHAATATRMHERTMRRYDEELALLQWLAAQRPARRPLIGVENTLLADFVERLASGDRQGAETLARFGRERIPRFAGSKRDRLMHAALRGGPFAGRALKIAQQLYLRAGRSVR